MAGIDGSIAGSVDSNEEMVVFGAGAGWLGFSLLALNCWFEAEADCVVSN